MIQRCFVMVCLTLAALATLAPTTGPAAAQGRFSPVVQVGDTAVTGYQIEQRARFLTLLGAPGDVAALAREQLVNEALQMNAARAAEMLPPPEAVEAGMAEFASRANLDTQQFLDAIAQAGVQPETFRDFITAGVAWRDLLRARFGDETRASIAPEQVRRTLARTGTDGGTRVLVSEVILPTTTPETAAASRVRAAEIAALGSEEAFAAAARRFSVAPSAPVGGERNWADIETLPPEVRGTVAALSPGQISRPVEIENAVAVFLLRDAETVPAGTPETLAVDYALYIAGDAADAAAVAARVDTCDDLYGVAKGQAPARLTRETRAAAQVPADIRAALASLDENETSTALVRSGNATVLMLCERKPALESTVDFDIIGNRLLNERITAEAVNYLAELRASTVIIDRTN